MKISSDHLNHLTKLAYLSISAETLPELTKDITSIFNFVEQLREVNTTDIQPLNHPLDSAQFVRDDQAQECHLQEKLASIAPQFIDDLYLVPKVIK